MKRKGGPEEQGNDTRLAASAKAKVSKPKPPNAAAATAAAATAATAAAATSAAAKATDATVAALAAMAALPATEPWPVQPIPEQTLIRDLWALICSSACRCSCMYYSNRNKNSYEHYYHWSYLE